VPAKKQKPNARIVESVVENEGYPEPKTPTDTLLALILGAMPKAPEGLIFCIPPKDISGSGVTEYQLEEEPDAGNAPWFSCNIINDGTDRVYVRFNSDHGEFHEIKKNEDLTIDLHGPKLKRLYFKCAADKSATVRIIGVR
jgi:hypothetical protein